MAALLRVSCRLLIAALVAAVLHSPARAQNAIFLSEGKIEFERKVNLYAQLSDDPSWSDLQKKSIPQFKTSYFDLIFTRNKTLYRPGKENPDNNKLWQQPAEENIVYSELDNEKMTSQKKVFEQLFLLQDSTRKIKWKITDENRIIAGFACRRANAIIMDSIYVVAFYTDEILASGGPESFSGLPGMILGVALPHQHTTWFATNVLAVKVNDMDLIAPLKGKKTSPTALKQTMTESMKDWDKKFVQRNLESVLL
jgi:GLPGLI family protein